MTSSRRTSAYTLPNPLMRSFDNSFEAGQTVFIVGHSYEGRFSINLTTGTDVNLADLTLGCPIAFHMDHRFPEKELVMNTMQNNEWGDKEFVNKLPLAENEPFDIRIRALEYVFEIFVNRQFFCTFDYVVPLTLVSHILVEGAAELYKVSWEGRFYPIPYETKISMTTGQTFFCSGFVSSKSDRFNLNLMINDEHALHFDVRLKDKQIVLNHTDNGNVWQMEQIPEKMPFERNMAFDIVIRCLEKGFDIFVNNIPLFLYLHFYRPEKINKINISGDVTLHSMHW